MTYDSSVKTSISEYNRVNADDSHIFIGSSPDATALHTNITPITEIYWTKYQIKETDFRTKTASFTTTEKLDLTQTVHLIRIASTLHENFIGYTLSNSYKENDDGTYTYQCQDMSRQYMGKAYYHIGSGKLTVHRILKTLLSVNQLSIATNLTSALNKTWKTTFSGLRPLALYEGKLWGNPISTNMMAQKPKLIIRNKTMMEAIRDICFANGYVDVYFDSGGTLQIEPISLDDWKHTGLWLTTDEIADREFKFDTTNAITDVKIESVDGSKPSSKYSSKQLTGLNLASFFGNVSDFSSNPTQSTGSSGKSSSSSSTSKATTKNNTTTNTTTKNGNPYGTKRKYLLIDGDGGETASFLKQIAKYVAKAGWKVDVDTNIGPGAHSRNFKKVKNGCYMSVYNGLCIDTIAEMAYSYYGGVIKKNGSVHCPAWDTRTWNERNKPYKYSIEKLKSLKTAYDWSGRSIGTLNNPAQYMAKNGIKYCLAPSAKGIADQFLAGGFRAYKGIK